MLADKWIFVLAAIIGGISISPQGAINAILGNHIGRLQAGVVSFAVGFFTLVVASVVFARRYPGNWPRIVDVPRYAFTGGILGAVIVLTTLVAVPKIGATATLVSILVGQVLISLAMDHFGWFGLTPTPIDLRRVLGLTLLGLSLPLVFR